MMKDKIAVLIVIIGGISAFTIHPMGIRKARPSLLVLNGESVLLKKSSPKK
jgi:hypothetical protein